MFDEFQYCLNLGSSTNNPQKNSTKQSTVSIIITPQTNIEQSAYNICHSNNLSLQLIPILIQSIQSQILQQIQIYKQSKKKNSIKNNQNDNKSKKFKNKFCQYLNQMQKEQENLSQSSFNTNENQQYSFRPTYMKILQLADQQELNYDYKHNDKQYNKKNKLNQLQYEYDKPLLSHKKSQRNVFEQLYLEYRLIQQKKQLIRKKSVQKLTFIPEINKMSRKIIQMKKNHNLHNNNTNESKQKQNKHLQSSKISTITNSNSRSTISIRSKPQKYISQFKHHQQRKPLNELNIYERGQLFLHKSKQKKEILNKLEILKQLQKCTFKPKILTKSRSKSRIKMF